jgi:hypothetical protein
MRGFAIFLSIFFLTFVLPLAVFSYTFNRFFTASYVKTQIEKAKIHELVPKALLYLSEQGEKQRQAEGEEPTQVEPRGLVEDELQKQLTAQYTKSKLDPFIDEAFLWLEGKRADPPVIDLADLKQKIQENVPQNFLSEEERQFLAEPILIEPFKNMPALPSVVKIVRISTLPLAGVSLLLFLIVALVAYTWKSKLRMMALALFIPAVLGMILSLALFAAGGFLAGVVSGTLRDNFGDFQAPVESTLHSAVSEMGLMNLAVFAALIVVALIFYVISFFVHNQPKNLTAAHS